MASLPKAAASPEVRLPERIGPRTAKAELKSPMASDGRTSEAFLHGPAIWDVLVHGHGSVKTTAFSMGRKDESLIRRQVQEGTIRLREFMEADEKALCEFAEWVLDTFKPARKSKQQIAREQIPQLIALMLDLTEDEP